MYTPLHLHTAVGSLLDSMVNIPDLMTRLKDLNFESCSITDHGNMMGVIEFYQNCIKNNIKPIIGMEAYYTPDCSVKDKTSKYDHLVLLAKNNEGYKDLKKLASESQLLENFYSKPRVDNKMLEKYGKNIIASSACLGGTIPRMIMNGEPVALMIEKINMFKGFFDEFYLELQPSTDENQIEVNKQLLNLSKMTKTDVIVTTDVHRIFEDQMEAHQAFISIVGEGIRSNEFYVDTWLKTEEEIIDNLSKYIPLDTITKMFKNTNAIASKCNVTIELGNAYCPKVKSNDDMNEDELFREYINEGLQEKDIWSYPNCDEYIKRVKYEYKVIKDKSFQGYFIIMREYIRRAKEKGIIIGLGRGSGAGCLIAWLFGITQVDSIRFGLSFERFLNPDRASYPDIDTDIADNQRSDFVDVMKEVSGGNVFQVMTTSTMRAKAVIASVGKVLGYDIEDLEDIKKKLPENGKVESLKKLDPKLYKEEKELIDLCCLLEGSPKSVSGHASAVVVIPDDYETEDFVPLMKSKSNEYVTQWNGHDIESVGLVKFDILGLRTLTIVNDTIKLIGDER